MTAKSKVFTVLCVVSAGSSVKVISALHVTENAVYYTLCAHETGSLGKAVQPTELE